MLPYGYNRKLGYYQVGDEEFEFKIQALLQGDKNYYARWVFNNDVFNRVKWKEEPSEDLKQLYYQRARQIREKYDYLILSYSGGSDSWMILDTFLSNGLKIDELIYSGAIEVTKNKDRTYKYSTDNFWMEYHDVIVKEFEYLKTHHPEIKLVVKDWSVKADTVKTEDAWLEERSGFLGTVATDRWQVEHMTDSVHKHTNIGYIVGYEKPRICIKNGKYYIYFLDFIDHQVVLSSGYTNPIWTTEFFYWAPESEKMLRKQAHIIKKFYDAHPEFKPFITWPIQSPAFKQFYETSTRALIYPGFDLRKFQAPKYPSNKSIGFEEVLLDANPKLYKDWEGSLNELFEVVPDKYISNNTITGFVSDFYEL